MPLPQILDQLEAMHGRPAKPAVTDPFELILLENVAYLVSDDRRLAVFHDLAKGLGLSPQEILKVPRRKLVAIVGKQAERVVECCLLALEIGDLRSAEGKALERFPGIGAPGAQKIRLLGGREAVLALDSNALRVLLRLGYGDEAKSYATSYRSAQKAAMAELPEKKPALIRAMTLLRTHGQEVCKRTTPLCEPCAAKEDCAYFSGPRGPG